MPNPAPNQNTNALGQPIGFPVEGWRQPPPPAGVILNGRYCRLERLHPESHAEDLFRAYAVDTEHRTWTYLGYGPFAALGEYRRWVEDHYRGDDPLFYAIVDVQSDRALGVASYLRVNPTDGVIEVGNISYSPLLQKTSMATEAMFLMMRHIFDDLGYRRYEWKCDALNAASRAAALRLGFTFEGVFRQATMYRQRNRDTVWYSIIDSEWPRLRTAYQAWLAPENFDRGRQKISLAGIMRRVGEQG
jgi:RimJ/RimL family protein N-acetyltransferase